MIFKPTKRYGEAHECNGSVDMPDGFYFSVDAPDMIGRISGYVTPEQFNWLAERIGTPKLDCGSAAAVGEEPGRNPKCATERRQQEDAPAPISDPDYDGAPYCSDCGARKRQYCKCPPRPRND